MKNKATILCLLTVMILTSCSKTKTPLELQNDTRAKLINVSTDLSEEANWWIVPEATKNMTIYVEAANTDIVLFWISPTGTETGKERTLIGYDVDGDDGWTYTWEFGERIFHDHIQVQALGIDGISQSSKTFNIHSPQ